LQSFRLDELEMKVYVTIGTEEHIWEPSRNLEEYMPGKRVMFEQLLFLMLLDSVYVKKSTGNFELLAHEYRESLGMHIPDSSVFGIINYLRSILKSFGPLVEPLISQYYTSDTVLSSPLNTKHGTFNTKRSDCFTCCIL